MDPSLPKKPRLSGPLLTNKFLRFVNGPLDFNKGLEQRLFVYVMFLCMVTGFFAFIANAANGLDMSVQIVTLVAGILFTVLWLLARRGISHLVLVYPATVILIGILSLEWFLNAGSRGGVPMYLLLCPFIVLIFSRGVSRIINIFLFVSASAFLLTLEYVNPDLLKGYASDNQRLLDVTVSFFLCQLIASIFVLVIHNGYVRAMQKSNEEKRESEARFFETADMLPVVICEAARDLSISFINKAGSTLTGFGQGEIGQHRMVLDLLHPEDRMRARDDLNRTLSGERLSLQEYRLVRKDGAALWVLMQCDHVYKESTVTALRMCMIDVTEKKMLEEQYRQAQKMESIGFLAGGMAHDFNNILSVILGYAFLIQKDSKSMSPSGDRTKLEGQVTAILKAGDRAADLVKKLLAFSRQGSFEVKPLDMHDLINEVEALLSHSIDKRISIVKDFRAQTPVVSGDQVLLQSALLNLAINARDAMPAGGTLTFSTALATIEGGHTVKSGFTVTPGRYLTVAVEDTGIGMDENTRAHLFEPFFTTKAPGKGTGLGLASVFGTVRRHNGFIEANSSRGSGTAMILYLPLCGDGVRLAPTAPAAKKSAGQLHILVIDDEEMICSFVKEYLDGEGYRTTVFTDAARAIDWYKRNSGCIDCAIIDMNMPGMDGRECFTAMRKINPKARGIFATGFSVTDTATLIRMPGISGFIQKPFALENLTSSISRIMKEDA
jgi:two-component system, cell cycle sensor histidine kinase and response regulator CckA